MSINNPSWTTKDKITTVKLAQMVADGVNSTDNIHPQYWRYMMPQYDKGLFYGQNLAGAVTSDKALYFNQVDYLLIHDDKAYTPGNYEDVLIYQFGRGISTTIELYALVKAAVAGIAQSDVKFRFQVDRIQQNSTRTISAIYTDPSPQNSTAAWGPYTRNTISLSGAASSEIIQVKFQVAIFNLNDPGDAATAEISNALITRTEPDL